MSADSEVFEIEEKVGRMSVMITNMLDGKGEEKGRGGRRERERPALARLFTSLSLSSPLPFFADTETDGDTVPLPNVSGAILSKV